MSSEPTPQRRGVAAIRKLTTQLGAAREEMQLTATACAGAWNTAQDEANRSFDIRRKSAAEVSTPLQKELGIDQARVREKRILRIIRRRQGVLRKLAFTLFAVHAIGSVAMAQEGAFELSASAGYTLSDGVTFAGVPVHDDVFNRIEPKDSFSFNATLGYFVQDDVLIEFIWSRQKSSLELGGTRILDLGDLNIDNYMGQFAWHFNDSDEPVRPYVSLGLGWTRYGSISFTDEDGDPRQTSGKSRFSGSLGAGIKIYPGANNVGIKLNVRWTPTYIKSDPGGIWCDPYWGCFQTANPQYSNQFEFTGGLSFLLGR